MNFDEEDRKVNDFVVRLAEATRGEINYNISREEFPDEYTVAASRYHNCNAKDPCGGEFRCARCRRRVGWCMGHADDITDGLCDECTVAVWEKVGIL